MSASAVPADPAASRTVVITRSFDAPARIVFLAMSKPEHVMKWFGPVGWPLTLCEMDFRVGGKFRFAMTGSSGVQNTPFGGTYHEIVKDRRIVYDNGFETAGAGRMLVTIDLDEKDGKTTLAMSTLFDTQSMYGEHVGAGFVPGTNSGYDQLVDVVADLKRAKG